MKNSVHFILFFFIFFPCSASGSFNIVQFPLHTELCQVGEKVDKVRGPGEAAGSAQFRRIVLTATIKTEGLSAAPLRSAVALMLVFSFSATSARTRFRVCYCAESGCLDLELIITAAPLQVSLCARALSHRLACCQRLARHKGEARLNEALEVPVQLKLGAF